MESSANLAHQLQQIIDWSAFWQLTLAAVLGGIVGLERELTGHAAGLRTNILVATSSCLFTILSIKGFPLVGNAQDTARVAAQVVTGVGFLGAGAVIQTKRDVHGLTTAATIWMVAAVGMSAATDLYMLGVVTTLLTTGVLFVLAPMSARLADRAEARQRRKRVHRKQVMSPRGKAPDPPETDEL
jgi:putative Mg2+ transporter-C (MgtC) family protein